MNLSDNEIERRKVRFTLREKEILRAIALGKTTEEIGEYYSMKPGTVKTHVRTMFAKTGTKTRASLIALYLIDAQ